MFLEVGGPHHRTALVRHRGCIGRDTVSPCDTGRFRRGFWPHVDEQENGELGLAARFVDVTVYQKRISYRKDMAYLARAYIHAHQALAHHEVLSMASVPEQTHSQCNPIGSLTSKGRMAQDRAPQLQATTVATAKQGERRLITGARGLSERAGSGGR